MWSFLTPVYDLLFLFSATCFFFLMIRRPPRSTPYPTLFPTRRSSDLRVGRPPQQPGSRQQDRAQDQRSSEEHTSALQSHSEISYAVFCLKKKKLNRMTRPVAISARRFALHRHECTGKGAAFLEPFFLFNDTAPPEIFTLSYTLSLHDALPIFLLTRPAEAAHTETRSEETSALGPGFG